MDVRKEEGRGRMVRKLRGIEAADGANNERREKKLRFQVRFIWMVAHARIFSFRALQTSQKIQEWAKEWTLGCVNPASWLPLASGASSCNLGPTL